MKLFATLMIAAGTISAGPPTDDHRILLGSVGQTRREIQQRERETGHHLPGVRVFRRWNEPIFDGSQRWARDTGHTVFVSIKSRRKDGSLIAWRDIAAARPGSPFHRDMLRQAAQIRRFGALVYVVFNHEPDAKTSRPMGTPAEFTAAWRRVVTTYRAAGVRNARYVWTLTGDAFAQGAGYGRTRADAYYPGDAYVDDIAADSYNWYTCHSRSGSWRRPAQLIEPQRRFGMAHPSKGLMLLEWGSVEDPARPGRKAQWLRDTTRLLSYPAYRQFRAVLHWDDRFTGVMDHTSCDFDYRTSTNALAAWRSVAFAPVLSAAGACTIGDCLRHGHHRRSRLPLVAGGAPVALVVAGLAGVGIHRRRRRIGR